MSPGYQGQFCETDVDECSLYMQNTTNINQGTEPANNCLKHENVVKWSHLLYSIPTFLYVLDLIYFTRQLIFETQSSL